MTPKWQTDNWWVSPFNFDSEALGDFQPQAPILHDVTLRDGEECAGLVFTTEDKLTLARALDEAGLPRIELLVTTPGAEEAIRAIQEMGLKATIYVAGNLANPDNMAKAIRCNAKNITLGLRSSDIFIERVLGKTREAVLEQILATIATAREHEMLVNLFLADSTRANLDFLAECVGRGQEAGIDAVTVVDSLGVANPQAVAYLVNQVKTWTDLPIEVHTHNDFGLGMATALAGWVAGASVIHTAVNSLGYRCGNPATEEMALTLHALYGLDTGVKLDKLYGLSQMAQERSGLPVAFNKPLSGPGAFAYERYAQLRNARESGAPQASYPYLPETIGRESFLFLSKWSDMEMVKHKVSEFGRSVTDTQAEQVLQKAKDLAYQHKRPVRDNELMAVVEETTK